MNTRKSFLLATVVVLAAALSSAPGNSQVEPEKRPGTTPQKSPIAPPPNVTPSGPAGAPTTMDDVALKAQTNAMMQRMTLLSTESQELSESFGKLAANHHGADRSEILVMQRMSAAMGTMSADVRASFAQYKQMLDDETASDSGAMKDEVNGLKGALDVMAGEIDDAVQTLKKLEAQLGQG